MKAEELLTKMFDSNSKMIHDGYLPINKAVEFAKEYANQQLKELQTAYNKQAVKSSKLIIQLMEANAELKEAREQLNKCFYDSRIITLDREYLYEDFDDWFLTKQDKEDK
jgi:hypothetical protein